MLKTDALHLVLLLVLGVESTRPVWNIAHMVNSISEVDESLNQGANSIEFDVSFNTDGRATYTYHGVPCDCFRVCTRSETFTNYLEHVRQLTTPGDPKYREELVLLFPDFKLNSLIPNARVKAGEDVANKMIEHYWKSDNSGGQAPILLSVPSVRHRDFISSFRTTVTQRGFSERLSNIGVDFSGNEDLDSIRGTLESLAWSDRVWQGDGITNCLPRGTARVLSAMGRRDDPEYPYIHKVYWWTVDRKSSIRDMLLFGVDGMITNHPERFSAVLDESDMNTVARLANRTDDPWSKHLLNPRFQLPYKLLEDRMVYNLEDDELRNLTSLEQLCNAAS